MIDDLDELEQAKIPTAPAPPEFTPDMRKRVDDIETLAAQMAVTAVNLKDEIVGLARNLDVIVGYLREVSQRLSEITEWRDRAERRLQDVERKQRSLSHP